MAPAVTADPDPVVITTKPVAVAVAVPDAVVPPATTKPAVAVTVAAAAAPDAEPALLHRSLLEQPHQVVSATGSYLHLADGRRILDACGGAAVAVLGHGNAEVAAAVAAQMGRVSYVHTLAYGTQAAEDLARAVLDADDSPLPDADDDDTRLVKAYFVGSGSEANDAALKCARQYWVERGQPQRRVFVARRQAYHGNTIGAMSVSDVRARKDPFRAIVLPDVAFVRPADAVHQRRPGEDEAAFAARLVAELDAEFRRLGPETIVSFVAETVSGAALGSMPAPRGYWPGVRALCDRYGILLHLDEVMCGTGRTGTFFAFAQEGVRPDIVTLGKGLGAGYAPIAAMLLSARVVAGLRAGPGAAFNHGHTYQAHPVACAAALAVQTILRRDRLVARVAALAGPLRALVDAAFAGAAHVADVRGRGFFLSVEFVRDKARAEPFPAAVHFGQRVQRAAFARGVAVYPGAGTVDGVLGDHATLAPPYTATWEELQTAVAVLKEAYDEVVREVVEEGVVEQN